MGSFLFKGQWAWWKVISRETQFVPWRPENGERERGVEEREEGERHTEREREREREREGGWSLEVAAKVKETGRRNK